MEGQEAGEMKRMQQDAAGKEPKRSRGDEEGDDESSEGTTVVPFLSVLSGADDEQATSSGFVFDHDTGKLRKDPFWKVKDFLRNEGVSEEGFPEIIEALKEFELASDDELVLATIRFSDNQLFRWSCGLGIEQRHAAILASAVTALRAETAAADTSASDTRVKAETTPPRSGTKAVAASQSPLSGRGLEEMIQSLTKRTRPIALRSVDDLYNHGKQNEALGIFSKHAENTVPFFLGRDEVLDMRFASMDPDAPIGFRTNEATQLPVRGQLYFRGVSGGGKTSAIFDFACHTPLIYVACANSPKFEEARTGDKLFARLVGAIYAQCHLPPDHTPDQLQAAQARAKYLIRADICVRLLFVLHLLRTKESEGVTAEQILLAQLYDAQDMMVSWFTRLTDIARIDVDELLKLTDHCRDELGEELARHFQTEQVARPFPIGVAIDEAQAAAQLFNANKGFHFDHASKPKEQRGLLYQYATQWEVYADPVLVTGTNMMSNTARQVPSNFGKSRVGGVKLPYLGLEDVKKRLTQVLDVSEEDLAGVDNLHLLTGRCRWVATLVVYLAQHKPWMNSAGTTETETKVEDHTLTRKAKMLNDAIAQLSTNESRYMRDRISDLLKEQDTDRSRIPDLLQRLHVVHWLFHQNGAGIQQEFSEKELLDLLGLGVVLLTGAKGESISVALDPIGAKALQKLANSESWDPAEFLGQRLLAQSSNLNAVQLGYEFETLVAAALVDYPDTVAQLIIDANGQEEPVDLPEWTKHSYLNFKYHTCTTAEQTYNAVRYAIKSSKPEDNMLQHGDDMMRPDYFAILRQLILKEQHQQELNFLFMGSAKLWAKRLSGQLRKADFMSTILEKVYTPKPQALSKNKDTDIEELNSAREHFLTLIKHTREITGAEVRDTRTGVKITGGRELRLHAILPGYAKVKGARGASIPDSEGPGFDPNTHMSKRVFIEGDKVRVIIDHTNYAALFGTSQTGEVVRLLLDQKAAESVDWFAESNDGEDDDAA